MTRLYHLALRAFPRRHRERYAAEMTETFARALAARDGHARLSFALVACLNVLGTGLGERRRQRRLRQGPAFSALDFTLAWRMLLRYPGLSLVSVLGMSVGITIAAGAFTIGSMMMGTTLPLPESDRLVSLVNWDASTNNREFRLLADLEAWRDATSIEDFSVSRDVQRNLIVDGRPPEVVMVAEISASAFRAARVPAYRGRTLLPHDERPDAPDALVIGHDEWVRRFAADPDIVGRAVDLGATAYTIVGVMPEGFGFPTYHSFWIPWRLDAVASAPRSGPGINVFGRLAPGATLESAQAELAAIGQRLAGAWPATHQHLRPTVLAYAHAFSELDDPDSALAIYAIETAIVLLLILICVNVAILVYARTATRQGEIAVRGALGASRRRIVAQLFVEALMLASVSAAIGIVLTAVGLRQLEGALLAMGTMVGAWPFWFSPELQTSTVIYVVGLTLLAAAIVGVAPALKATGPQVHTRLQTLSPGSGSRMQMGRLWTALIVAQVAVTVALLPMATYFAWSALRIESGGGYATAEFLNASLSLERAVAAPTETVDQAFADRYGSALADIERRLRDDARVREVTFSLTSPGRELALVVEAEGVPVPIDPVDYNIVEGTKRGTLVRFNRVTANFFSAFDVPVSIGRGLTPADASADTAGMTPGVLVSRGLVDQVFGGANPLGRRIKYVGRSREAPSQHVVFERWYEIVGVVPNFPVPGSFDDESEGRVYHAVAASDLYPARLNVRARTGDPAALAEPLRDLSASVDPDLLVLDVSTAAIAFRQAQGMMRLIGVSLGLVIVSVLLLSSAGIYSLMSFTVARRRREIGIRAALGANRNRILLGIFSRVLAQLGAGAMLGVIGAVGLEQMLEGDMIQNYRAMLLPAVVLLTMTIGVIAAIGPLRQGLRIQPIEALRDE
ncbi:MAG: ABC transporter permease [Acidobacteria bacterium]|nr:ABC transporter permease [Acidobacteriota bacterium]